MCLRRSSNRCSFVTLRRLFLHSNESLRLGTKGLELPHVRFSSRRPFRPSGPPWDCLPGRDLALMERGKRGRKRGRGGPVTVPDGARGVRGRSRPVGTPGPTGPLPVSTGAWPLRAPGPAPRRRTSGGEQTGWTRLHDFDAASRRDRPARSRLSYRPRPPRG